MLYTNARIYGRQETAFTVKDGYFDQFFHAHQIPDTPATDLAHQWVLPGFNDAHGHFIGIAYMAKMRPLHQVKTLPDLAAAFDDIKGFTMGVHYDDKQLALGRYLEKADLDQIHADIPLIVLRMCGHFAVANSAAIKMAKAYHQKGPSFAHVDFAKGHFKEDAIKWLQAPFFNPSEKTLQAEILAAQAHVLAHGITAFASDDFITYPVPYERIIKAYQSLAKTGALKVRLYQQAHLKSLALLDDFLDKGYAHQQYGRFKMGPSKLLVDGSLGAKTAAMKTPYQDSQDRGLLNYDAKTLHAYLQKINAHQMDFAWHAIGDRATQVIIDAVKATGLFKGARPAIIHAQLTGLEEIHQMKALGIGAQVQPIFLDDDIPVIHAYLGDKANDTYLFKTLYENLPTALSTDAPIVDVNPFHNLYTAITRRSLKYPQLNPHLAEEAMNIDQAIDAYTHQAAYFMREDDLGVIAPGYQADFIVVKDFDINTVASLKKAAVMRTVIAGQTEYLAR